MVLTDSTDLATTMYSLRDWGKTYKEPEYYQTDATNLNIMIDGVPYDRNYGYDTIGFNFKLLEMGAAFGTEQFKRLPSFVKARNKNFEYLAEELTYSWNNYFIPVESYIQAKPSWFFFPLILRDDCEFTREEFMSYLEKKGIHTRLFFAGNILRHPALRKTYVKVIGDTNNADKLMEDALMIGVHPGMDSDDLKYIVKTINEFLDYGN
jgi:CDP-6-deoxy-D-xylo-4-hexulose-3-dehydrase